MKGDFFMSSKVVLLLMVLVAGVAVVSCSGQGTDPGLPGLQTAMSNQSVSIPAGAVGKGPAAFGTNPLVVSTGTMVTWTNNDSIAHTVTSDDGTSFDSGALSPGQTFSHTFDTAGTFPYHCSIHGAASMSGTVQVNGASPTPSGSPSPSPSASPSPSPSASPSPSPSASASPTPAQQSGGTTTYGGGTGTGGYGY
jgi:plastocyanin